MVENSRISQERVWDRIAPEWNEYKKIPSEASVEFLRHAYGNVLDLGSGSGRHMTKIRDGKMWMLDFSAEMLELAKEKSEQLGILIETIHSSMDTIPIQDDFFDFAICISSLHCVEGEEHRRRAVEQLYRVMKDGGLAYIGVWNINSKRFRRKKKKGKEQMIGWQGKGERYYYLFSEDEVHALFESVGFEVVETHNSEMMINFVVRKKK